MLHLEIQQIELPHDSKVHEYKYFTTLEAKKGTLVYGITDGRGHWFRHCWLKRAQAEQCLENMPITPDVIAVNVCTDASYLILTA